jgi:hypothetical protein
VEFGKLVVTKEDRVDLKELEKMKVDQLREEAAKLEGVEGISAMKKQELFDLLCEKLDIQRPEAQSEEKTEDTPPAKDVESEDKVDAKAEAEGEAEAKPETKPEAKPPAKEAKEAKEAKPEPKVAEKKPSPFKGPLKALQAKRKQALADRDSKTLADVRVRIKKYKRKMKKESAAASSA